MNHVANSQIILQINVGVIKQNQHSLATSLSFKSAELVPLPPHTCTSFPSHTPQNTSWMLLPLQHVPGQCVYGGCRAV